MTVNTECFRIADQLRRAFAGDPWHGDPLRTLLAGITPAEAIDRPLAWGHNIHELVLHIDLYVHIALEATAQGTPMPKLYHTGKDWLEVTVPEPAAWSAATGQLFQHGEELARVIEAFSDARLPETVPGRDYDFYYLFHGIVQHSLYHGGQIALLRKKQAIASAEKRI